jgi:hypothetical protein
MIHPSVLHKMLPTIVPLVLEWVMSVERDLKAGSRTLTADEKSDAIALGITHPDAVRVAIVDHLPEPSPELKHLAQQLRILTPGTLSLSFGRLIVIKKDAPDIHQLVLHGLVHALQTERCGGVQAFLTEYFKQCLNDGHENCAMEVEARDLADALIAGRV